MSEWIVSQMILVCRTQIFREFSNESSFNSNTDFCRSIPPMKWALLNILAEKYLKIFTEYRSGDMDDF